MLTAKVRNMEREGWGYSIVWKSKEKALTDTINLINISIWSKIVGVRGWWWDRWPPIGRHLLNLIGRRRHPQRLSYLDNNFHKHRSIQFDSRFSFHLSYISMSLVSILIALILVRIIQPNQNLFGFICFESLPCMEKLEAAGMVGQL